MKKIYILLGILLLSFIVVTILVLTNNTSTFDDIIYNYLISLRSNNLDTFLKIITSCANVLTTICLVIIILLVIKDKYKYIFGFTILGTVLLNTIVKNIISRPRPDHLRLITQGGYSYPSGHSMISIALYGFLIYYVYKKASNIKVKVFTIVLLTILIILIGISRIYLGVHYPSDVLGGYLFASIIIIITIILCDYYIRGNKNDKNGSK